MSRSLLVRDDLDAIGLPLDLFDEGIEGGRGLFDSVAHPALSIGIIQVIPDFHQCLIDFNEGFQRLVGCFNHGGGDV